MRRTAGSRLGATSTLSVVLALGITAGSAAAVPTPAQPTATAGIRATADVELPRPARGANAVRLLGDRLDEAADSNDMTGTELTALLTTDPTAWVDTTGAVFFKEGVATAPAADPVSAQAPLAETFQLHSKPGATRTIFLDFDGGTASGTAWHATYPTMPTTQPAWDTGGNAAVFDDAERTAIQTVWKAVAEDYAPFDVDVTTADPGPAGINRAGALDTTYGSHVLITPSVAAHDAMCGGCGGVAYIGVFDKVTSGAGDGYGYNQPAWVFPHKLGNSPKNIAEAASHEVGHNVGLSHDANATQGYDSGHGAWAPIMGVGYDRPISQWSKGDYAGATNQEDDVAIIRSVVGSRLDEAPTAILAAPSVPTGTAYVDSRTDVDTYLLGTCSGAVSVAASPLASQANLDLRLTILDDLGQVVATDDPASAQTSTSTASGMGASLTRTLASGTYYASVDGVGNGPWSTGYDDYGSLGAYALAATGCGIAAPTQTSLTTSVTGRDVTLGVQVTTDGGEPAGTVQVHDGDTLVGTAVLSAGAATLTLPSVAPGEHPYRATFAPSDTAAYAGSSSAVRTVTMADVPVVPPDTPTPTPTPTADPLPTPVTAPAVSASATTLKAPRKAKAGARPRVRVTVVRGTAAAIGTVVITVGKTSRTLTLKAGVATLRLPKLKAGKLRITVRYAGDTTTTASTAKRTIRVTA